MKQNKTATFLIAVSILTAGVTFSFNAYSQKNASTLSAVSVLSIASVVVNISEGASKVVEVPLMLSVAGASLVIKAVEASVVGTVYVLERVSDGAQASVEVVGKGAASTATAVGTSVKVSVISAGVVLSAAGEVIAFIPNEIGRALMHNTRMTK